jgi:mannitol-specific phosphotransferase system IIBC component
MKNFIANNWVAIIGVLVAIIVGLAVSWIIMDRKDKKLIAEYKSQIKAAKSSADKVEAKPVEEVEDVKEEVAEEPKKAPAKKSTTATKATSAKKPASKTAKK